MKAKICTYGQKMFSKIMNRRSANDLSFGTFELYKSLAKRFVRLQNIMSVRAPSIEPRTLML